MYTVFVSLYVTCDWIWSHQNEISKVYHQDAYIFCRQIRFESLNYLIHIYHDAHIKYTHLQNYFCPPGVFCGQYLNSLNSNSKFKFKIYFIASYYINSQKVQQTHDTHNQNFCSHFSVGRPM